MKERNIDRYVYFRRGEEGEESPRDVSKPRPHGAVRPEQQTARYVMCINALLLCIALYGLFYILLIIHYNNMCILGMFVTSSDIC